MVGVVVACLVTLFLVVAVLVFFLACRRRLFAAKPSTQTRQHPVADARALQASAQSTMLLQCLRECFSMSSSDFKPDNSSIDDRRQNRPRLDLDP